MTTTVLDVKKKSSARVWLVVIVAALVVVGILAFIKVSQIRGMMAAGKNFKLPPETVSTAKVESMKWEETRPAVATLVAMRAVTLQSELSGTVREIDFDSGGNVHKGDVLVRLDTSVEEAQLAAAEADEKLARVSGHRAEVLREKNSNTVAELDAAKERETATGASVQQLRATIAKKTIRAPFDGRLGIRQVELGQVVGAGTPLVSLQSVSPIHAEFWLPQQVLSELHVGLHATLTSEVFPGQKWDGLITLINPEIDVATRNVRVRATFANQDGRLRPGMFGNVSVLSNDERTALVIPATSVMYAPYGDSVFSVEERALPATGGAGTAQHPGDQKGKELIAHQKFVRLGERRGDLVAVTNGLAAGETIVSGGAFKLHNGSTITVNNDLAPDAELAPKPVEK